MMSHEIRSIVISMMSEPHIFIGIEYPYSRRHRAFNSIYQMLINIKLMNIKANVMQICQLNPGRNCRSGSEFCLPLQLPLVINNSSSSSPPLLLSGLRSGLAQSARLKGPAAASGDVGGGRQSEPTPHPGRLLASTRARRGTHIFVHSELSSCRICAPGPSAPAINAGICQVVAAGMRCAGETFASMSSLRATWKSNTAHTRARARVNKLSACHLAKHCSTRLSEISIYFHYVFVQSHTGLLTRSVSAPSDLCSLFKRTARSNLARRATTKATRFDQC